MTREEIEIMIRAMEEHLEVAEAANSASLTNAIEDALAVLEELTAINPDDHF
mgnify:CR=1 FL=1|tara:strand:- start:159 stop:314 length:156 start_codon:yes stop_codon:yes gene_type:complete